MSCLWPHELSMVRARLVTRVLYLRLITIRTLPTTITTIAIHYVTYTYTTHYTPAFLTAKQSLQHADSMGVFASKKPTESVSHALLPTPPLCTLPSHPLLPPHSPVPIPSPPPLTPPPPLPPSHPIPTC